MKSIYYAHFTPSAPRVLKPEKSIRFRVDEEITAREIRVLDSNNQMIGIMSRNEALRRAAETEMNLVEIAPQAKPPVCKIIDFGKFVYEQQKRDKHQRKQQQQQQMKEIRFKWRIATHDFNFKARHARKFLEEGNKVKASVMFRGREIVHQEIGRELLEKFIAELDDVGKIDQPLRSEGKLITVVISPDKTKMKK